MTETETQFIREFFKDVVGGWTGEGWTPIPIVEVNFQDQGDYTLVELLNEVEDHVHLYFPAKWTIPQVPASASSETVPSLTPQQILQALAVYAKLTSNPARLAFELQGVVVTSLPTHRSIVVTVADGANLYSLDLPYSVLLSLMATDQGSQDAPPG